MKPAVILSLVLFDLEGNYLISQVGKSWRERYFFHRFGAINLSLSLLFGDVFDKSYTRRMNVLTFWLNLHNKCKFIKLLNLFKVPLWSSAIEETGTLGLVLLVVKQHEV